MTLTTRESIAVAELVVYIPTFALALFVCARQGFSRGLGFFYLVIFSAIRVAGAVVEILSQQNPSNKSYAEWAGILSSIGLSPLLLASIGLLGRVYVQTTYIHHNSRTTGNKTPFPPERSKENNANSLSRALTQ